MSRQAAPRAKLRRFLIRRQFYRQLPRIVYDALRRRDARQRVFVSMMGGVGDLVNLFPTIEKLSQRAAVDLGTGRDPYAALARCNPYIRTTYSPFVYKPIRSAHRRLIERVLSPFYARVILLDEPDSAWQARSTHMSQVYAEKCGCLPPRRGAIYLSAEGRQGAAEFLRRHGLADFIYVVQLIRRERPLRSWPLPHYHELLRMVRRHFGCPILVHTFGSDETDTPGDCLRLERADILTVAGLIERARLYIGPDTGPTHIAAALGVPTVSIHLGFPPEVCRALGDNVALVHQRRPFDDPANTSPAAVFAAVERIQQADVRPAGPGADYR